MERLVSMRVKSLDWVNQPKRKLMSQSPDAHPGAPPLPTTPPTPTPAPSWIFPTSPHGPGWGPLGRAQEERISGKTLPRVPPNGRFFAKEQFLLEPVGGSGSPGSRLGPGLQPPARAPDEALGSAVTASQTCLLTSLPSRALGSQENPGRGMRSQKRQEDRLEKGLGRGAPPPQIWRVGRRRRVGRK